MGMIAEGFRHFWLRDIRLVGGVTKKGFGSWMTGGDFIVTEAKSRDEFTIKVLASKEAKRGIAHDITKMASAAFETMLGIDPVRNLPKSTGWIVIRAYYAAFFAAHSLLRMLGTICLQLEGSQTKVLDRNAALFGNELPQSFEAGFYIARCIASGDEIHFRKSGAARRGSHEMLWEAFAGKLREVSNHLLSVSSKFTQMSLNLSEIENLLMQDNHTGGTWLSHIRNRANYRHDFGLWFPYSGSEVSAAELVKIARKWQGDPNLILPLQRADGIKLHVWICTTIVAICHEVVCDMEENGLLNKSFHSCGSLALVRMAN